MTHAPVGDLLLTMRERAATLSKAQQQVAATVLDDPQFALRANVDALARRAKVSPPSIVRFCRALGFAGLREFKLQPGADACRRDVDAASGTRSRRQHADRHAQGPAGRGERAYQPRAAHRAGDGRTRGQRGSRKRGVSIATPSATHRYSWPATPRRDSRGSASTSNFYFDAYLQLVSAATMTKSDVVLAISHVGRMPFLLESVGVAKEQGATIIAMTQPSTPLAEMADIVLPIVVPADPLMRVGTEAYLAQTGVSGNIDGRHRLAPRSTCNEPVETRAPGAAGARRGQRNASGAAGRVVETRKATVMSAEHNPALLLRGGTVIDGTGAPRFVADVRIEGERISAIGAQLPTQGAEVVDVAGKIVAPGFIDVHTHDDQIVLAAPQMLPKISQGVTTVVIGNCGISLAPLVHAECAAAAQSAGRRQVRLPDDGRVCRSGGTGSARGQRGRAGRAFDPARRDDERSIPSRDARRASANGRTAARRHGCRRDRPELRCVLRDRCSR